MTNKEPDDAKFPVKALNVVEVENPIIVENDKSSLSLVCSDEDDEVSCYDNDITTHSPQPIVNVVNCSDVVIGSVTQYHGPVTIVQHAHSPRLTGAIKEKETDKNNEAKLVRTNGLCPNNVSTLTKIVLGIACITVLTLIIPLCLFTTRSSTDGNAGTNKKLEISGHNYVLRDVCGTRAAQAKIVMTHPAEYVLISQTSRIQCSGFVECCANMRDIQNEQVAELNIPDVTFNFMIGGDGNIYVGRGWHGRNFHEDKSISICFSGNFTYDVVSEHMIDAFHKLLEMGSASQVLARNYKIIPINNETFSDKKPDKNLYKFIKILPNFYSEHS